jgi:hypothetical protein
MQYTLNSKENGEKYSTVHTFQLKEYCNGEKYITLSRYGVSVTVVEHSKDRPGARTMERNTVHNFQV